MIHKELDMSIDETFFWTDSVTVLQYINSNTARFKTFVANRIAIIRDGSNPSQWRHVETQENPADYSSRGQSVQKFIKNKLWSHGPEFLWKPETEWPVTNLQETPIENDPEIKAATSNAVKQVKSYALKVEESTEVMDVLLSYHSNWYNLKKP
jgi:hypothetical protein